MLLRGQIVRWVFGSSVEPDREQVLLALGRRRRAGADAAARQDDHRRVSEYPSASCTDLRG